MEALWKRQRPKTGFWRRGLRRCRTPPTPRLPRGASPCSPRLAMPAQPCHPPPRPTRPSRAAPCLAPRPPCHAQTATTQCFDTFCRALARQSRPLGSSVAAIRRCCRVIALRKPAAGGAAFPDFSGFFPGFCAWAVRFPRGWSKARGHASAPRSLLRGRSRWWPRGVRRLRGADEQQRSRDVRSAPLRRRWCTT